MIGRTSSLERPCHLTEREHITPHLLGTKKGLHNGSIALRRHVLRPRPCCCPTRRSETWFRRDTGHLGPSQSWLGGVLVWNVNRPKKEATHGFDTKRGGFGRSLEFLQLFQAAVLVAETNDVLWFSSSPTPDGFYMLLQVARVTHPFVGGCMWLFILRTV